MKKDTIVQFVCFITDLEANEFGSKWEIFARPFTEKRVEISLEERVGRSRFKYISRVVWPQEDFLFAFMNKKKVDGFPEHTVKLVQAGGYSPLQVQNKNNSSGLTKVMAFVGHNENDISFYKGLPSRYINIYQAYYESCTYAYIFEFLVEKANVDALTDQLKTRHGVEVAVYNECLVPQL